jgi:hypothetical protein
VLGTARTRIFFCEPPFFLARSGIVYRGGPLVGVERKILAAGTKFSDTPPAEETIDLGFEAKPGNPKPPVLRPNREKPSKQEIRAPRLLVHGADRTQHHPTSRSFSHQVPDLCLIIPGPLHQVSYSCHDPHCCPPCHTCLLHTTRQANAILHTI